MPFDTSRNPQNAEECRPARPFRPPASDRSVHGNDAVARLTAGTLAGFTVMDVGNFECIPEMIAAYICCFLGSISLANATRQPCRSKA